MQAIAGRAERPSGGQGLGPPIVASPLQGEINSLKGHLEKQSKIIEELRNKLAVLFVDKPTAKSEGAELVNLSEMPSKVRDCRFHAESNTDKLIWLIENLEV